LNAIGLILVLSVLTMVVFVRTSFCFLGAGSAEEGRGLVTVLGFLSEHACHLLAVVGIFVCYTINEANSHARASGILGARERGLRDVHILLWKVITRGS
jgi:hypothetical protein